MPAGPLSGLRVLELASGVAGPYAGRLFAMLGATVVKAEPPGGDPARELPVDDRPTARPSPVFVHLNCGKRLIDRQAAALPEALAWADVVIDDGVLDRLGRRPATRAAGGPLVVTVTAGSGWPGEPADEPLVQAATGVLSASRDEHGYPLRLPGWQSQYLAGAYAAAAALAGLGADADGAEVTWAGAALTAIEAHAAGELYAAGDDATGPAGQHGGFLDRTFPSGVFACADGFVIPGTVRPVDWVRQCELYGRPELVWDPRYVWANRWRNRARLRDELTPWYLARRRRDIFAAALRAGWAAATVMTGRDALTDPHLRERGFLTRVHGDTVAVVPARPWRSASIPEGVPVRLAGPGGDREWFTPRHPRTAATPRPPRLAGLRVVELTWAWAGPFVGRFLGALGADVVRVEVGAHPDGWRTRRRRRELGVAVPDGVDPEEYTWDGAAQFNSLNRNKRGASVDLSTPDGADVFCRLVSVADVLLVNMNHQVLADRGVEERVLARVDRGLVLVTMPALGASGPYREMPGYGMLTEGMGGFAARYGHPAEGARASTTYFADAVSGVHGVVAVLAALAERSVTGAGTVVDLSQQETMWLQLGEGIVLASREGREPARLGCREPGVTDSGVRPRDGRYVAYVGARTEPVRTIRELYGSGALARRGMLEELDHPVAGRRAYLGIPVRLGGHQLASTRPAPTFDEHTDEVLAEWLRMPAQRVAELRANGSVGTRPRQPRRRAAASR